MFVNLPAVDQSGDQLGIAASSGHGGACEDEPRMNRSSCSEIRTPPEVQRWFREHGVTVADWSASQGFSVALVYAVIQGNRKCLRGQSHRIAVALGLKAHPIDTGV